MEAIHFTETGPCSPNWVRGWQIFSVIYQDFQQPYGDTVIWWYGDLASTSWGLTFYLIEKILCGSINGDFTNISCEFNFLKNCLVWHNHKRPFNINDQQEPTPLFCDKWDAYQITFMLLPSFRKSPLSSCIHRDVQNICKGPMQIILATVIRPPEQDRTVWWH